MENIIIKFASEGVLAEQSLVNQPAPNSNYFHLLQHIPLPIFSLNLGLAILDMNQAAAEMYGWERNKVIGKSFIELCIRQGIVIPQLPNLTTLKQTQAYVTEVVQMVLSTNKTHAVAWHILRFVNEQQQMDGFLFIGQPKNAPLPQVAEDQRVIKEADILRAQAQSQRELLTHVAHELLPSMQAIIDAARSLTVGETEPGRAELVNNITQQSQMITGQLENLDSIARIDAQRLIPNEEPCDLRNIVEEVIRDFSPSCQRKGLKLIPSYPLSVVRHLLSDRQGLRLILKNLISNAYRFTERGTIFVAVTCKEQIGNHANLEIKVQDSGKGIDPALIAQVLEGTPNTEAAPFTLQGYGLRVVKAWVHAMGGTLRFESQPNSTGASVVCALPLKLSALEQDLAWQSPCNNLKVLVIDDCQLRGEVILQHFSNHPGSARMSGEDAMVRFVAKESFDPAYQMIIVDDENSGVTPLALARQVRAHPELSHCMLVLCARSSTKALDEARANGYSVILQKPVQPSDLINIIQNEWVKWFKSNASRREERKSNILSVLLVEDNQLAQKISKSMLEDLGCKVSIAGTGEEALRAMENHYDAIFMDVGLPDCDGLEVTRRIRRMHYDKSSVPIIAMTAHVSEHDKRLCFESGMDDFISKPISYESLQKVLQRCVLKTVA